MDGSSSTLSRVLDLLDCVSVNRDPSDQLVQILQGLGGLIDCDVVGFNHLDRNARQLAVGLEPASAWRDLVTPMAPYVGAHPLTAHFAGTEDLEAQRMTDICPADVWLRSAVYQDVFAPHHLRHQLAFASTLPNGDLPGVLLSRSGTDFSDRDRRVLTLVAPRLLRMRDNTVLLAGRSGESRTLTERETTVLTLMAQGSSAAEIGRQLNISPRTVQKHAEHIYAKLDARGAVAAVHAAVDLGLISLSGKAKRRQ